MFGRHKPIPFDPYGSRRKRRRFPPWLFMLLSGIAIGSAGVVFVQERYLPPRLSAGETDKLRNAYDQAEAARLQLKSELEASTKRLAETLAAQQGASGALEEARADAGRLREELAAVIKTLPPDPRGGSVEVRSGDLGVREGALAYDVVLTRARAGSAAFSGVMQLLLTGDSARGIETTVSLPPVPVSIAAHAVVRGRAPLPAGFKPRQATIRVLDRAGGSALGMRVLLVD